MNLIYLGMLSEVRIEQTLINVNPATRILDSSSENTYPSSRLEIPSCPIPRGFLHWQCL